MVNARARTLDLLVAPNVAETPIPGPEDHTIGRTHPWNEPSGAQLF